GRADPVSIRYQGCCELDRIQQSGGRQADRPGPWHVGYRGTQEYLRSDSSIYRRGPALRVACFQRRVRRDEQEGGWVCADARSHPALSDAVEEPVAWAHTSPDVSRS